MKDGKITGKRKLLVPEAAVKSLVMGNNAVMIHHNKRQVQRWQLEKVKQGYYGAVLPLAGYISKIMV